MNKQGNTFQRKEQNKSLEIKPKEVYIYELPGNNWKIIVLKERNDIQDNTDRKLNKIRKTVYKQNNGINKDKN